MTFSKWHDPACADLVHSIALVCEAWLVSHIQCTAAHLRRGEDVGEAGANEGARQQAVDAGVEAVHLAQRPQVPQVRLQPKKDASLVEDSINRCHADAQNGDQTPANGSNVSQHMVLKLR